MELLFGGCTVRNVKGKETIDLCWKDIRIASALLRHLQQLFVWIWLLDKFIPSREGSSAMRVQIRRTKGRAIFMLNSGRTAAATFRFPRSPHFVTGIELRTRDYQGVTKTGRNKCTKVTYCNSGGALLRERPHLSSSNSSAFRLWKKKGSGAPVVKISTWSDHNENFETEFSDIPELRRSLSFHYL